MKNKPITIMDESTGFEGIRASAEIIPVRPKTLQEIMDEGFAKLHAALDELDKSVTSQGATIAELKALVVAKRN